MQSTKPKSGQGNWLKYRKIIMDTVENYEEMRESHGSEAMSKNQGNHGSAPDSLMILVNLVGGTGS
jgi:hypothetical protein